MSGVLHLVSDAGGVGASIFISLLLRALIGLHGYSGGAWESKNIEDCVVKLFGTA